MSLFSCLLWLFVFSSGYSQLFYLFGVSYYIQLSIIISFIFILLLFFGDYTRHPRRHPSRVGIILLMTSVYITLRGFPISMAASVFVAATFILVIKASNQLSAAYSLRSYVKMCLFFSLTGFILLIYLNIEPQALKTTAVFIDTSIGEDGITLFNNLGYEVKAYYATRLMGFTDGSSFGNPVLFSRLRGHLNEPSLVAVLFLFPALSYFFINEKNKFAILMIFTFSVLSFSFTFYLLLLQALITLILIKRLPFIFLRLTFYFYPLIFLGMVYSFIPPSYGMLADPSGLLSDFGSKEGSVFQRLTGLSYSVHTFLYQPVFPNFENVRSPIGVVLRLHMLGGVTFSAVAYIAYIKMTKMLLNTARQNSSSMWTKVSAIILVQFIAMFFTFNDYGFWTPVTLVSLYLIYFTKHSTSQNTSL